MSGLGLSVSYLVCVCLYLPLFLLISHVSSRPIVVTEGLYVSYHTQGIDCSQVLTNEYNIRHKVLNLPHNASKQLFPI